MQSLQPLGDRAALAHFADEAAALRFAEAVRRTADPCVEDIVQAYRSVAVFFDLDHTRYAELAERLRRIEDQAGAVPSETRLHRVPCCYELQHDLARVAEDTGLPPEQVVRLHLATEYAVYAIGFCPGFPYLGYLPPPLCGVPRLDAPRLRVEAGSVGLTGRQTGIYTEPRPGGWNLIGRTPLVLVDVADGYFPLRTGDRVRFERINEAEYRRREGQRLE